MEGEICTLTLPEKSHDKRSNVKHRRYPTIPLPEFKELVSIVRKLRKDCPWDREQTHQSIRQALIEETYEVIEALDNNNLDELQKELGDLLLHIILHATIAEQAGEFSLKDVLSSISDKLVRRHPHVFGQQKFLNSEDVTRNWEQQKMQEGRTSVLEGVPGGLPALQSALRVQERAAKVGFDWKTKNQVWKKVEEEAGELRDTLSGKSKSRQEEEFGDFLFALVNYARFLDIEPETALRNTVSKFRRRFRFIEEELAQKGSSPHQSTLGEMDALWNKAKARGL